MPTEELLVHDRSCKKKSDTSDELSSEEENKEILVTERAMLKTTRTTLNPEE